MSVPNQIWSRQEVEAEILRAIPAGMMVVGSDGGVRFVNQAFEEIVGGAVGWYLGERASEVLPCASQLAGEPRCGMAARCGPCAARQALADVLVDGRPRDVRVERLPAGDSAARWRCAGVSVFPVDAGDERLVVVLFLPLPETRVVGGSRESFPDHGLIGADPKMREVFRTISLIAPANVPVLILGESGTGKEMVAIAIHRASSRAGKVLVPVNCGALPEGLLESELFGHVRGAFSGAVRDKKGRFELASGGTIFLDEIGELPLAMQVKLLRVLQDGTFQRVGGEHTVRVDVRVICATNRDLATEVAARRFRADLYYRLCVVPITLPPLRERRGDIPPLADHLLESAARENGRRSPILSPRAIEMLHCYSWPGNVRELDNVLRYALLNAHDSVVRPEHFPVAFQRALARDAAAVPRRRGLTREAVADALRACDGNRAKAARFLGVSRATFYRFLADNPAAGLSR